MDDSEFDKLYADKIRRTGAPDFSDEDWERLTPALDARERRRWRVLPLWWLGALSALLLCSNLGWWYMWQQSEKRSEALQNEWRQIRQQATAQRDTSWSKVVVYQYDTVYKTVVYRSFSQGVSADNKVTSGPEKETLVDHQGRYVSDRSPQVDGPINQAVSGLDEPQTELKNIGQNQSNIWTRRNLDILPAKTSFLKSPERPIKLPDNDLVFVPLIKSHAPRQALLIPKKIRLGAGAGLVLPSAPDLYNSIGFSTTIHAELAFSDQLALTLEGGYAGIPFTGKVYNESLGLPPLNSPGDDYVLRHFETEEGLKPILQLSAGLRYWFQTTHKLSPYLGFAYAAQWHPAFELKLEYTNSVNGTEKELTKEIASRSAAVSLLDIQAGVRYRFLRQLYWQSGASYQFKIDPNQPGIPRFWGVKTAVLYEF